MAERGASRVGRGDILLLLGALVSGAVFLSCLGRLWPLVAADLNADRGRLEARARAVLEAQDHDLHGFVAASRLSVDADALDYLEREFGREEAQRRLAAGLPIVAYRVLLKRGGDPDALRVALLDSGEVLGWSKGVQEDRPGASLGPGEARRLAHDIVARTTRLDLSQWTEKSVSSSERPARRDHAFVYERLLSAEPELRERASVAVAGDQVVELQRQVVVPAAAARGAISREAPGSAIEMIGFLLAGVGVVAAFAVFLRRLRDGTARLGRAAAVVGALFLTQLVCHTLQTDSLLAARVTLWPAWISIFIELGHRTAVLSWTLLALLAFIAAGDALDREIGAGRGRTLWALARGRWLDPGVAAASGRGYLVGLLCGGVLTAACLAIETFAGGRASLQPRGFFFYPLNSASPSLTTLLFFLNVALAEELGYRFFGATWLLSWTRRRWVAVLFPALVYGLAHTGMSFLPPAEPFWGRAVVMTLVGCVWGWALLRYDALTVVLSHFTADLFIFSWPRFASGQAGPAAIAALICLAPLIPFAGWSVSKLTVRVRRLGPAA